MAQWLEASNAGPETARSTAIKGHICRPREGVVRVRVEALLTEVKMCRATSTRHNVDPGQRAGGSADVREQRARTSRSSVPLGLRPVNPPTPYVSTLRCKRRRMSDRHSVLRQPTTIRRLVPDDAAVTGHPLQR